MGQNIPFKTANFWNLLQKLSVVKSINSRTGLCTEKVFNFSKAKSIINVLSH